MPFKLSKQETSEGYSVGEPVVYIPLHNTPRSSVGIIEQVITGETGAAKSASPKTPKVHVHATPDEPRYLIRNLKTGKRTAYKRYNIMRKANEEEVETKHSDFSLDKNRSRHAEPPHHGVPLAE